jgi:excisionase family DNA binding protein
MARDDTQFVARLLRALAAGDEIEYLRAEIAELRERIEGASTRGGLLDAADAGKALGVSVPTIRRVAADGRLPSVRIGRAIRFDVSGTWYSATRHTYASQWVLAGGSIEMLSKTMGHSSIQVTQRYAHLTVDLFRESDYQRLLVDLSSPTATVTPIAGAVTANGTKTSAIDNGLVTEQNEAVIGSVVTL